MKEERGRIQVDAPQHFGGSEAVVDLAFQQHHRVGNLELQQWQKSSRFSVEFINPKRISAQSQQ